MVAFVARQFIRLELQQVAVGFHQQIHRRWDWRSRSAATHHRQRRERSEIQKATARTEGAHTALILRAPTCANMTDESSGFICRTLRTMTSPTQSVYRTRAKLWRWSGEKASWYFLTLPPKVAREISLVDAGPRRIGFGALKVEATIGGSTWQTSVFPSAQHKSYLLPVKAAIRKAEGLQEGKTVGVRIIVRRHG
jgi:hypothetical protein